MSLLYTIMPDFGGAYAWSKDANDSATWVGGNCGSAFSGLEDSWDGDHPISAALAREFAVWQRTFESMTVSIEGQTTPSGGWHAFHERGLALAKRLQSELGVAAAVRYRWPIEDPHRKPDATAFGPSTLH